MNCSVLRGIFSPHESNEVTHVRKSTKTSLYEKYTVHHFTWQQEQKDPNSET